MDGPVHGGVPSLARPGHESVERRLEAVCQQVAEWTRSDGQTVPQWALPLPGPGVVAVAACDYQPGTGAFPSGPCGLDILTATAGGATASVHAGQGLDFAFSAGPF